MAEKVTKVALCRPEDEIFALAQAPVDHEVRTDPKGIPGIILFLEIHTPEWTEKA